MYQKNSVGEFGKVLIDTSTVMDAIEAAKANFRLTEENLASLAQLVHALVIYEHVFVEARSYEEYIQAAPIFNEDIKLPIESSQVTTEGNLLDDIKRYSLSELIQPVDIETEKLDALRLLADKHAEEVSLDFANLPQSVIDPLLQHWVRLKTIGYEGKILPARVNVDAVIRGKEGDYWKENITEEEVVKSIARRAYLYFAISCHQEIPYIPNAFRAPLIEHNLKTKFFYKKMANAALELVEDASLVERNKKNKIIGEGLFKMQFPLIFTYILSKVKKDWSEIIPRTLEFRETKEAKAFRNLCANVDRACRDNNMDVLADVLEELQIRSQQWGQKLKEPSLDIGIAFPLAVEINPLTLGQFIREKRKRYLVFLDKLYMEAGRSSDSWSRITQLIRQPEYTWSRSRFSRSYIYVPDLPTELGWWRRK